MGENTMSETRFELMLEKFKLELFKELTDKYATREQLRELADAVKELRAEVVELRDKATGDIAVSRTKERVLNGLLVLSAAALGSLIYILGQGGFH